MNTETINAMMIDPKDTVAVVIEPVKTGESIAWREKNGRINSMIAKTDVPIYHKVAILEMEKGSEVIKYGEHIGLASKNILPGEHVHVHNVENHREKL